MNLNLIKSRDPRALIPMRHRSARQPDEPEARVPVLPLLLSPR